MVVATEDNRIDLCPRSHLHALLGKREEAVKILTQVRAKINDGDLEAAGQVYRKLRDLAPQSEETIQARDLIRAALIKQR